MVQQSYAKQRRAKGLVRVGEESTMVEHSSDGTITDLGTLVIIDDDPEEMDTMKSEWVGWGDDGMSEWRVWCVLHVATGVDTGVVDKEAKEYRPGFIQHYDKKEEKRVGRKQAPQGPHDISYYFPDIPEGMDFREFVSYW